MAVMTKPKDTLTNYTNDMQKVISFGTYHDYMKDEISRIIATEAEPKRTEDLMHYMGVLQSGLDYVSDSRKRAVGGRSRAQNLSPDDPRINDWGSDSDYQQMQTSWNKMLGLQRELQLSLLSKQDIYDIYQTHAEKLFKIEVGGDLSRSLLPGGEPFRVFMGSAVAKEIDSTDRMDYPKMEALAKLILKYQGYDLENSLTARADVGALTQRIRESMLKPHDRSADRAYSIFPKTLKTAVYISTNFHCSICHLNMIGESSGGAVSTLDHQHTFKSLKDGNIPGGNSFSNLYPAHRTCNSKRSDATHALWEVAATMHGDNGASPTIIKNATKDLAEISYHQISRVHDEGFSFHWTPLYLQAYPGIKNGAGKWEVLNEEAIMAKVQSLQIKNMFVDVSGEQVKASLGSIYGLGATKSFDILESKGIADQARIDMEHNITVAKDAFKEAVIKNAEVHITYTVTDRDGKVTEKTERINFAQNTSHLVSTRIIHQ